MVFQILHRFRDQLEILFFGDAERPVNMQVPALSENRNGGRRGVQQCPNVGVLIDLVLGEARGSEGRQPGVFQFQLPRALEELLVLGIGIGPAAFDVIDTQLVQLAGR